MGKKSYKLFCNVPNKVVLKINAKKSAVPIIIRCFFQHFWLCKTEKHYIIKLFENNFPI